MHKEVDSVIECHPKKGAIGNHTVGQRNAHTTPYKSVRQTHKHLVTLSLSNITNDTQEPSYRNETLGLPYWGWLPNGRGRLWEWWDLGSHRPKPLPSQWVVETSCCGTEDMIYSHSSWNQRQENVRETVWIDMFDGIPLWWNCNGSTSSKRQSKMSHETKNLKNEHLSIHQRRCQGLDHCPLGKETDLRTPWIQSSFPSLATSDPT